MCFIEASWGTSGTTADGKKKYFVGRALQVHSERIMVANFALYIRVESSQATDVEKNHDMMCMKFKQDATEVVVRISTSLISHNQAVVNLERELKWTKNFESIALDTKMVWNK